MFLILSQYTSTRQFEEYILSNEKKYSSLFAWLADRKIRLGGLFLCSTYLYKFKYEYTLSNLAAYLDKHGSTNTDYWSISSYARVVRLNPLEENQRLRDSYRKKLEEALAYYKWDEYFCNENEEQPPVESETYTEWLIKGTKYVYGVVRNGVVTAVKNTIDWFYGPYIEDTEITEFIESYNKSSWFELFEHQYEYDLTGYEWVRRVLWPSPYNFLFDILEKPSSYWYNKESLKINAIINELNCIHGNDWNDFKDEVRIFRRRWLLLELELRPQWYQDLYHSVQRYILKPKSFIESAFYEPDNMIKPFSDIVNKVPQVDDYIRKYYRVYTDYNVGLAINLNDSSNNTLDLYRSLCNEGYSQDFLM